jgi:hypothetical protein
VIARNEAIRESQGQYQLNSQGVDTIRKAKALLFPGVVSTSRNDKTQNQSSQQRNGQQSSIFEPSSKEKELVSEKLLKSNLFSDNI